MLYMRYALLSYSLLVPSLPSFIRCSNTSHQGKTVDYSVEAPKTRMYDVRGKDNISVHAVECDLVSLPLLCPSPLLIS